MSMLVRVTDEGDGVVLVTLDDPDRRNAMGFAMAEEMTAVCRRLATDETVRAVVVTGAGPAFCAGADLPALFGDADRPVADRHAALSRYYRAFLDVHDLAVPTVAAVGGPAVGAGLNLALACDVRIAGPKATFGATFARIGLHPGGGCTHFLVQALGASRALRVLLLGATLDAGEAIAAGLTEGPEDDPLAAGLDLARQFAAVDPAVARSIKRTVRIAAATGDRDAVVAYESWAQAVSAASPALQEWVARFSR